MQSRWLFAWATPMGGPAQAALQTALHATLAGWQAHGTPVASHFAVHQGHFLVVEALSPSSGCGIDWMTKAVHQVLAGQGVPVVENGTVFAQPADQDPTTAPMQVIPFAELPQAFATGQLTADSWVYDTTQANLDGPPRRPLRDTWLKRYLRPQPAATGSGN